MDNKDTLSGWHKVLDRVSFVQNCTPTLALGWKTPFDITYRTNPRLNTPLNSNDQGDNLTNFQKMSRIHDDLRLGTYKSQVSRKNYFYPTDSLKRGTIVFQKRMQFNRHNNKKLQAKIIRAFEIIERVATGLYLVTDVTNGVRILLPIDQMVRTGLNLAEVKKMIEKLNER